MREKVLAELDHIPKRPKPAQSYLRMIYFMSRMRSLGKKAQDGQTALDVLKESMKSVAKDHPEYRFIYDETFFHGKGKK